MLIASKTLGYKLRIKRAMAGISQRQLNTLLGGYPSPRAIHGYETGQRQPNEENMRVLKEFLKWEATLVSLFVKKKGIKPD